MAKGREEVVPRPESLIVVYFAGNAKYHPPENASATTSCVRRT
jgi:hypothetical protein